MDDSCERIQVRILDGALPSSAPWRPAGAGAVLSFEGVVRPTEAGRPIVALQYDVYEPMASGLLRRIAEDLVARHGLIALRTEHSRGRVAVGERSFRLQVAAAARLEALAAVAEFIDRLKRDVPIWKSPVYGTP